VNKLGLFGKKNNEEKDWKLDQYDNVPNKWENKIRAQKEELEIISKKLALVKVEYDEAVGNLMSVKKELIHKKFEVNSIGTDEQTSLKIESDESHSTFDIDLQKQNSILKEIKIEIEKNEKELDNLLAKQSSAKTVLNQSRIKQKESEYLLQNMYAKLKQMHSDLKNTQVQKQEILNELKRIKERELVTSKKSTSQKDDSKHVVEAAGAVIKSMQSKLQTTKEELAAIKEILEKVKKEHLKTKEQLASLKSQSKR